jgi:hypothetical protein
MSAGTEKSNGSGASNSHEYSTNSPIRVTISSMLESKKSGGKIVGRVTGVAEALDVPCWDVVESMRKLAPRCPWACLKYGDSR